MKLNPCRRKRGKATRIAWGVVSLSMCVMVGWVGLGSAAAETSDPLEEVNRPIYSFNDLLDRYLARPVVDVYRYVAPEFVRESVSNFYDNLTYPNVILNDFLQGKFTQGVLDTSRFLVNTSLGVGGLFDPAAKWGMKEHHEDFGQTLGVWGLESGPYLVLPALGPNSGRDAPDLAASTVTNVLFYVSTPITVPIAVLGFIDKRARAEDALRTREEVAVEPYVFTREAYLQHRDFLIHDGQPPLPDLIPEDAFVDLEDRGAEKTWREDPS